MTKEKIHEMGFCISGEIAHPPFRFPCVGCRMPCGHDQYWSCFGDHDGDWFPDYEPNEAYLELYRKVFGINEPPKVETEAGIQYLLFEM